MKWFYLVLVVFPVCHLALGYESCDSIDTLRKFRQLERDIPSLYLLNGLHLSKQQSADLLELQSEALSINSRFREQVDKLYKTNKEEVKEQTDWLIERVVKGKAPNMRQIGRKAGSGLRRAHLEIRQTKREKDSDIDDLSDKVYKILNPGQRHIVETFIPCFIPDRDFRNPERVGQAAGDTSFTEKVLKRLRSQKKHQYEFALQKALDRLVPYAMRKKHIKYSEETETEVRQKLEQRLRSVSVKMFEMSDSDFELEKSVLATELLPLETDKPDAENRSAARRKIRQYLLNTGVIDVLSERSGKPAPVAVDTGNGTKNGRLDIRNELRTARMFAALDLSVKQAEELVNIVCRALNAKQSVENEIAFSMQKAMAPYQQLRSELSSSQPTAKKEQSANHSHHNVKTLYSEKLTHELLEYEAQVDLTLTSDQVEYLSMSGKKSLRESGYDLESVDQGLEDAKHIVSKGRRMLPYIFQKDKRALCREFIEERIANLEPGAVSVEDEVDRACEVLARVRKMSHVEYTSSRTDLAVELCPRRSNPRPTVYGHKYDRGRPVPEISPSSRLLFSETALRILEGIVK